MQIATIVLIIWAAQAQYYVRTRKVINVLSGGLYPGQPLFGYNDRNCAEICMQSKFRSTYGMFFNLILALTFFWVSREAIGHAVLTAAGTHLLFALLCNLGLSEDLILRIIIRRVQRNRLVYGADHHSDGHSVRFYCDEIIGFVSAERV